MTKTIYGEPGIWGNILQFVPPVAGAVTLAGGLFACNVYMVTGQFGTDRVTDGFELSGVVLALLGIIPITILVTYLTYRICMLFCEWHADYEIRTKLKTLKKNGSILIGIKDGWHWETSGNKLRVWSDDGEEQYYPERYGIVREYCFYRNHESVIVLSQ